MLLKGIVLRITPVQSLNPSLEIEPQVGTFLSFWLQAPSIEYKFRMEQPVRSQKITKQEPHAINSQEPIVLILKTWLLTVRLMIVIIGSLGNRLRLVTISSQEIKESSRRTECFPGTNHSGCD